MTTPSDQQPGPPLPPRLADDLSRLYPPGPPIPQERNEAILARARVHFARRRRLTLILTWAGPASAAAAVIVAALWLAHARRPPCPPLASGDYRGVLAPAPLAVAPTSTAREDINHDGRVDILDALMLARRMENRATGHSAHLNLPPTADLPDINGDGRVDQADVDAIARSAVLLDRGSLQ